MCVGGGGGGGGGQLLERKCVQGDLFWHLNLKNGLWGDE